MSRPLARKKIGKYILGQKLGEGAFSVVREAEDITTGKKWAIKIMKIAQIEAESMEEQLKREIAISKKMNHPNIVQMREVFKTRNHINIVLEFVTGGELFDRIVKCRYFEEPVARRFFQQLIQGLKYCHDQGVAHRDLKPENLLLDSEDNLKIMDFGLSALQSGDKLLTTTAGTPNYVAPEVLADRGYDGRGADLWSCGVILYVMLAGRLPFEDQNMHRLFDKIRRAQFVYPRNFPEAPKDLINLLLVPDPAKRATLDDVYKHPWFIIDLEEESGEEVDLTNVDIDASIDESEEYVETLEKAGPTTSMNAFDLASRLMAGKLAPLMSGAPSVKSNTRFMANASVEATMEKLTAFLHSVDIETQTKKDVSVIKCNRLRPRLLNFAIHIIPTVHSELVMVDVRRGRGDRLEFNDVYRQLAESMGVTEEEGIAPSESGSSSS